MTRLAVTRQLVKSKILEIDDLARQAAPSENEKPDGEDNENDNAENLKNVGNSEGFLDHAAPSLHTRGEGLNKGDSYKWTSALLNRGESILDLSEFLQGSDKLSDRWA